MMVMVAMGSEMCTCIINQFVYYIWRKCVGK